MTTHGFILKTVVLLCALSALASCDFFRTLAGRPTSAEIAVKKEAMLRDIAAAAAADSAAAADTVACVEKLDSAASVPVKANGRKKYYIILGSFSNRENAENIASLARGEGFPVRLIVSAKGFVTVALCGTDSREEIEESLQKVKACKFCPPQAWIMVNKQ